MLEQLEKIEERYDQIEAEIARPEVATDANLLRKLAQERAEIEGLVSIYRDYKKTQHSLDETRQMLKEESDDDLKELARQEIESLEAKLEEQNEALKMAQEVPQLDLADEVNEAVDTAIFALDLAIKVNKVLGAISDEMVATKVKRLYNNANGNSCESL